MIHWFYSKHLEIITEDGLMVLDCTRGKVSPKHAAQIAHDHNRILDIDSVRGQFLKRNVLIYDGDTVRGTAFKGEWVAIPRTDHDAATEAFEAMREALKEARQWMREPDPEYSDEDEDYLTAVERVETALALAEKED